MKQFCSTVKTPTVDGFDVWTGGVSSIGASDNNSLIDFAVNILRYQVLWLRNGVRIKVSKYRAYDNNFSVLLSVSCLLLLYLLISIIA